MRKRALGFILICLCVSPPVRAEQKLADFTGELDLRQQAAVVNFKTGEQSEVKFLFRPTESRTYQLSVQLKNVSSPFFDISTHLNMDGEVRRDATGEIVSCIVKLSSQYTLLNRKPVSELSGQLLIRDHKVFINSLVVETMAVRGEGDFLPPHHFKARVQFFEVPLRTVLSLLVPGDGVPAEGNVTGEIDLKGTPMAVEVKADITSSSGSIGDWAFRNFMLQGEGRYPHLDIRDSLFAQSDGILFKVIGSFDLSRPGDWVKQFSALRKSPIVDVEGQTSDWTLKRIESDKKSGITEIKYRLRQNKDIQTMSDENLDLIEIQRKVEF